ncbi:hypothetical protein ASPZODRAFT_145825 [Penicilliopsis zonata CBS 506.65]|uniref:Zn(2)-C6 fungal-type domain-containing protein n=1 Tax=Penicilliopsis zonata CBS 506.65 TaxID=1073090 RepID=A0A1L9S9P3_9EURO|nr:hypothetical protein ASPZODRAFT_145825 [Penicilliopsis zonata CBS 506.65]OJJ43891.1 hypothetical protein ASPZODRAFT_145825 [Penicilliopsis zonata CBS 506.65]
MPFTEQETRGKPARSRICRTKTGCRTCRVRRVKCDEARPACQRCVSTGRVCDGYGIWGGGGNAYGDRHRREETPSFQLVEGKLQKSLQPTVMATVTEQFCADWLIGRTSKKIGGVFPSEFWSRLVVQATAQEPAVRHAALALASAHRGDTMSWSETCTAPGYRNGDEKFTLQQYNKAIACLQGRAVDDKDICQIRVAFIACMVFITLEILRGQFQTSRIHLQHGKMLLKHIQSHRQSTSSIDNDLVEAFTCLEVQFSLFGFGQASELLLETAGVVIPPSHVPRRFNSPSDAKRSLNIILRNTQRLVEMDRRRGECEEAVNYQLLLQSRCVVERDLELWIEAYKASLAYLKIIPEFNQIGGFRLLMMYHTMATIMVMTSLLANSESVFDMHLDRFIHIVQDAIQIHHSIRNTHPSEISAQCNPAFRFTADMGFIPPLYYTALKCRVPRIRRQALKLLRSTVHREGVWDGLLAGRVAEQVIALEERSLYRDSPIDDNFDELSPPLPEHLVVPPPPESCRISDVQVTLPDHPRHDALLVCCKRLPDGLTIVVYETKLPVVEKP